MRYIPKPNYSSALTLLEDARRSMREAGIGEVVIVTGSDIRDPPRDLVDLLAVGRHSLDAEHECPHEDSSDTFHKTVAHLYGQAVIGDTVFVDFLTENRSRKAQYY